ncbi:alpha/beta hydrolase family protein [Natrinema halophilum]|uniref:CocE/NonD family hydrolase n=1 Tax=Natrinema halophilum TaxID=1699371 RepID=A0A7D5KSN0_9EURY|nr:CocE/NonD family hydrolase [Natrinema halophilum]QLG50497.1 CocE/NonD family hydrolase [Natrinema halophilum]
MVSYHNNEVSKHDSENETSNERIEARIEREATTAADVNTGRVRSSRVDRRQFLQATGGTATLLAFGSGTAAGWSSHGGFSKSHRTISSFDGTDLATTLYTPDADGPNPAIMMTHGWGQSRNSPLTVAKAVRYAKSGYVVLTYDSRGMSGSDGISTINGENEVKDAIYLIDWLAGRSEVELEGPNDPKLGMDGISYAGGLQPFVALADDRVNAIVPRMGWYDLTYSFVPNGVVKNSWLTILLVVGAASTFDFDPDTRLSDRMYEWYGDIIGSNGLPPDPEAGFEQRSLAYNLEEFDTPTFLIQGWDDTLFNPNEGLRWFYDLQARGIDSAIAFYEGGHAIEEIFVPLHERKYMNDLAVRWMDEHLRGAESEIPTVSMYLKQRDEWRTGSQFLPDDVSMTTYNLGDAYESDQPHIEQQSWFHDSEVTYVWRVDRDIEIIGTPQFDLTFDVAGSEARLFFEIRHNGSDLDHIGKPVTEAYRIDGSGRQRAQFDFPALQRFLAAGDTLSVRISVESILFEESNRSDGVTVVPSRSEIRLPQRPQ